jgi:hypothetical protein
LIATRSHKFGFVCQCQCCGAASNLVAESDKRRTEIARLEAAIGDGVLIMTNPSRALQYCQQMLDLLQREGEEDTKVHSTYYDAFQICVAHGDLARPATFAGLAAEVKMDCQGRDADGIEELDTFIRSPQKHRLAGTTNRWRSKVQHARLRDNVSDTSNPRTLQILTQISSKPPISKPPQLNSHFSDLITN